MIKYFFTKLLKWDEEKFLKKKSIAWKLFDTPESAPGGRYICYFMLTIIVYSSLIVALQTEPKLADVDPNLWLVSEVICTAIFTIEYLIRLYSCPSTRFLKYNFLLAPLNLCDLIAILPFYIDIIVNGGVSGTNGSSSGFLRVIRVVRLIRVFRVLKAGRYTSQLSIFFKTYKKSRAALGVLLLLFVLLLVFFSTIIYEVEKDQQPLKFGSIPQAMYFCVITMTTVGYGDRYPMTTLGKIFAGFVMVTGIIALSLPVTIIGAESIKQFEYNKRENAKAAAKAAAALELIKLNSPKVEDRSPVDFFLFGGNLRLKLWTLLDDPESSVYAKGLLTFVASIIVLSCLNIILSSMPELAEYENAWNTIETICIAIFTIDYGCRWILFPESEDDAKNSFGVVGTFVSARVRFMTNVFSMIDLLAILPYYITLSSPDGGRSSWAAVRVLRLIRVTRIFKLGSHSRIIQVVLESIVAGSSAFGMLGIFLFAYLLVMGSLLFECEKDEPGTVFTSIFECFWASMATVTTVGYGDMTPVTTCGQIVCGACAMTGVLGMTLPISIIGALYADKSEEALHGNEKKKEHVPEPKTPTNEIEMKTISS